jgi:hypothetical protein
MLVKYSLPVEHMHEQSHGYMTHVAPAHSSALQIGKLNANPEAAKVFTHPRGSWLGSFQKLQAAPLLLVLLSQFETGLGYALHVLHATTAVLPELRRRSDPGTARKHFRRGLCRRAGALQWLRAFLAQGAHMLVRHGAFGLQYACFQTSTLLVVKNGYEHMRASTQVHLECPGCNFNFTSG